MSDKTLNDNSQFLIQNERTLLRFFAAKNPITVLYFVLPYIAGCAYLASEFTYTTIECIIILIASFLYWSFAEYIIHRFFFHLNTRFKTLNYMIGSFHIYHHRNPDDLQVINSGWITAFFGLFLHGSIFYAITGSMKLVYALMIGSTMKNQELHIFFVQMRILLMLIGVAFFSIYTALFARAILDDDTYMQ